MVTTKIVKKKLGIDKLHHKSMHVEISFSQGIAYRL